MNPGDMLFATRRGDLLFAAPEDVAIARDLGGVRRCLAHAAAAVARGRYAAGFLAYEAAGAFDPALRTHAPGPLPLAWFGLYKNPPLAGPGPGRPDGRYQVGPWTPLLPAGAYRAAIERIRDLIVARFADNRSDT